MKQGKATRDVDESWKREPIPYKINQNFPSQIGTAIDPAAPEAMRLAGRGLHPVPNIDFTLEGPGAGRDGGPPGSAIKKSGGQGRY